jgi:hypothetical protein
MSDASVRADLSDARQSMIRFWMAISAVWIAFWLLIAGIFLLSAGMPSEFSAELAPFAVIVLTPPLVLLALGAFARWAFETVVAANQRTSIGK